MKHEATLLLSFIALKSLSVIRCTKGRAHKCLSFTACKERGPVDTRQHTNLYAQVANLIESPVIRTDPVVQNLIAEDLLAQKLIIFAELLRSSPIVLRQAFLQFILDRLDQRITFELRMLLSIKSVFQ